MIPTRTRGERAAVASGILILLVLAISQLIAPWGFNSPLVWAPIGVMVGLLMLAIAALVDRHPSRA